MHLGTPALSSISSSGVSGYLNFISGDLGCQNILTYFIFLFPSTQESQLLDEPVVLPRRTCLLPMRKGYRLGYGRVQPRFYFAVKTQSCEAFAYNGRGGNKNNFKSFKKCSMACGHAGMVFRCLEFQCQLWVFLYV